MIRDVICIMCPLGCEMKVEIEGMGVTNVEGNRCEKGAKHAEREVFFPTRILTTTMRTDIPEMPLLPVRSNRGILKEKLGDCVKEISRHTLSGSVISGQVVVENILGLGVDIVSCRTAPYSFVQHTAR